MPFFFRVPDIPELRKKGKVRSLIRAMKYTTKKPDEAPPWVIRSQAVKALGEIGDQRAVKPLLSVLSDGSERCHVREKAITALAGFQASEVIPHLVQALSAADVMKSVAEALSTLGWEPGSDEAGAQYWAGLGEWDRCVELGELSIGPLIDRIETDWLEAARTLRRIGDAAAEPLAERGLEALKSYLTFVYSINELDFRYQRASAISDVVQKEAKKVYHYFRPFDPGFQRGDAEFVAENPPWSYDQVGETVKQALDLVSEMERMKRGIADWLGLEALRIKLEELHERLEQGS